MQRICRSAGSALAVYASRSSLWEDVSGAGERDHRQFLTEDCRAYPRRDGQGRSSEGVSTALLLLSWTNQFAQDIIKIAFENGINYFDTAEAYAKGKSEEEMCVRVLTSCVVRLTLRFAGAA